MNGIQRRIEDAHFLWTHNRKESAFLLIMIATAALSKLRYPGLKDNEAFKKTVSDFHNMKVRIEFRDKLEPIEEILYKWVRCHLVHESELPVDLVFQEDKKDDSMSIRAGGAPEFILKLGTGWFFYFSKSILESKEIATA